MLTTSSWAVDGTDVETWGALRGDVIVPVDVEGEEWPQVPSKRKPTARSAAILGMGADDRPIYTADPDARGGHRSATNSRPAGTFVGYECHLAVQTRDVEWTNNVDKVTLSAEVPGVITQVSLVPAGTHRGEAVADHLVQAKRSGDKLTDVVADPGYSLCRAETLHHKLASVGIGMTFQPVTHQRGQKPFSGDAVLIDGQLYSSLLPQHLRDLPMPPRGAPEQEKLPYEAKFNERARWRMARHAGPDADGVTRWRCPFCAKLLRSRTFPKTMRGSRTAPQVFFDEPLERCCSGIISVMPAELPLAQRMPFGGTAWRKSYGRRQVVESANAGLKGGFVDLSRGFFRVFGTTKMTVLLGFTVAGYNLDRVRAFRVKHRLEDPHEPQEAPQRPVKRVKRRQGTWTDLVVDERAQAPPA
jgi:hypothetical protein